MKPLIIEDTRQHEGKHDHKHRWWDAHDVPYLPRHQKLDFGDYMRGFEDGTLDKSCNISVDTKRDVAEISANLTSKHDVFKREIARANDAGHLLIVLVENVQAFSCVEEVRYWTNPHCLSCHMHVRNKGSCNPREPGRCKRHGKGKPAQGPQVSTIMKTLEKRYGVRFELCKPADSALAICKLLGVGYE